MSETIAPPQIRGGAFGDEPAAGDSGFWGDLGRNLWAGTLSTAGALARAGEYATDNPVFRSVAEEAGKEANYQIGQMSPGGQRALQADLLPGGDGPSAVENGLGGFVGSVAAKAVNSLPSMFAAVIPGAIVARGVSAAAGMATVGTATGTLSAGSIFGAIADEVGRTPDARLRESSELYDTLREQGLDEEAAKQRLIRQAAGYKPLVGGVLSAVAGALTEGHAVANIARGGRNIGVAGAARQGAQGEAREEFLQSGIEDTATQYGLQEVTGQPYDPLQTLRQAGEGAIVGGAMGGAMGAAGGLLRPVDQPRQRKPAIDPANTFLDPDQRAAAEALHPEALQAAQARNAVRQAAIAPQPGMEGLEGALSPQAQALAGARVAAREGEQMVAGVAPVSPLVQGRAAARGAEPANPLAGVLSPDIVAGILARHFDAAQPADPLAGVQPVSPALVAARTPTPDLLPGVNPVNPALLSGTNTRVEGTDAQLTPEAAPGTVPPVAAAPPGPGAPAAAAPAAPAVAPVAPPQVSPPGAPPAPRVEAPAPSPEIPRGPAPAAPAPSPAPTTTPPAAPAAPTLADAVAQLPESDRALVAALPAKLVDTFWKASKGDVTGFLDRAKRSAAGKAALAAQTGNATSPAAAPTPAPNANIAPAGEGKDATTPATTTAAAPAGAARAAAPPAAEAPPAPPVAPKPAAKPKLTPMQEGAKALVEQRLVGIARAAGAQPQFVDDAIAAIMADLESELAATRGGASEIAKALLDKHNMKQRFSDALAVVEARETQDDAPTPAVAAKAKPQPVAVDERLKMPAVAQAVAGGAAELEKLARVLARVDRKNFILGMQRLHKAMTAAGMEVWPSVAEAMAFKGEGRPGGKIEDRAARSEGWDRLQREVVRDAEAMARPAREAKTQADTAPDRAFDAHAPKTKADLTPAGFRRRVMAMLDSIRQDNGGKLALPQRDAKQSPEEQAEAEKKVSARALWIRSAMNALAKSDGLSQTALDDMLGSEALLRGGDEAAYRASRRVAGEAASAKRSSIDNTALADVEEGREGRERGHQDFTGEGSHGREAVLAEGVMARVTPQGEVEVHKDGKVIETLPSTTAKQALAAMQPRNLGERLLIQRLGKLIPGMRVVEVAGDVFERIVGQRALGVYLPATQAAAQQGSAGIIFVNSDAWAHDVQETTLHEMVHAATAAKLEDDPRLAARLQALADALRGVLDQDGSLTEHDQEQFAYYLSNPHELLAGAFTDPGFQSWLAEHQIDGKTWTALTDEPAAKVGSFWDAFVRWVLQALRLPTNTLTTMHAVIRLGEEAMQDEATSAAAIAANPRQDGWARFRLADNLATLPSQLLESARPGLKGLRDKGRNAALAVQTARQIAESFQHLFAWTDATKAKAKAANPLEQVVQATLQRATTAREHRQGADGVVRALQALERSSPAQHKALADLTLEATVAGVHPDVPLTDPKNKHVSATRLGDRQARNAHPKLAAAWAKLSPEAQALYHDMSRLFDRYHSDVTRMLVTNILETIHFQQAERARKAGEPVPATPDFAAQAKRFLEKKETADDVKAVGEHGLAQIMEARKLARVKGPYFPQRRFGDYVVEWQEPVAAVHEFASEAAAQAFIDKTDLPVSFKLLKFDADGKEIRKAKTDDPNEPNPVVAKQVWRVTVQNKGLAFFDSRGEADAFRAELQGRGVKTANAVDLREQSDARRTDLLPGQLRDLVRSVQRDPNLDDARRRTTVAALEDAALRLLPGSSVKASWLRRRNVLGASRDLTRVAANYANAAANFLAKLEHAPQIDDGLSAMAGHIRESSLTDSDDRTVARRQVLREMQARADLAALDTLGGHAASPWIARAQSFAFVYYLASPAYTAINLLQPWMTGLPWLGARYGAGAAAAAMRRAMDDVGGLGVLKAGLRESAQTLKETLGKADQPRLDYLAVVKQHLQDSKLADAAAITGMLDRLAGEGLIDLTAGMELGRAMDGKRSWLGNKATQVEDMARALPAAAEVLNRASMAVAAYRLALGKGDTPEAAYRAAEQAVAATQFDYTAANTARVMDARRHPLLAPMFTFRKFAQGTYYLLTRQAYLAVRGATPEERRVAGRTLAGILGTHLLMAGALGLPTEPIKLALGLAAFLFGADEPWDYEATVRQALADAFGKEAGEVLARGLPRALGMDLSGRVGLDSLIFLKDLRDFKVETLGQYMGEFLIGAPGAALTNATKAPGLLWDGDVSGAAAAVVPKGLRDVIKAMKLADSGVVTRRGERIDQNVPLGLHEAAFQALGLQPARVQEVYEQRSAVKGAQRRLDSERGDLLRQYRQAEAGDRAEVWARIRAWNAGTPREARISFEQARAALRESTRRAQESQGGTYVPRNRRFLLEEGRFANTRGEQ